MLPPERKSGSGTLAAPKYSTVIKNSPAGKALASVGNTNPTWADISAYYGGVAKTNAAASQARVAGRQPAPVYSGGGGGGGGRRYGGGGGGGGGAAAAPQYSQAQLDWMANLLKAGGPRAGGKLDLTMAAFNPARYNQMSQSLDRAVAADRAAATTANRDYTNYLTTRFNNPYAAGPPTATAPGMSQQAMASFLQGQGVDPSVMAANQQGMAQANQGFANVWGLLGANENIAQQDRLNAARQDMNYANRALDVARLQGQTGIGMQRAQAQEDWQQRADALAQQEAMANWQQGNTFLNTQQEYRNAQIQALLGLLPDLRGTKLNLPTAQTLGW